jgi:type VI secretion system secreted protein VgrG
MPPPRADQSARMMALTVEGIDQADLTLDRFSYREELGRPYTFRVTASPRGSMLGPADLLGKQASVRVNTTSTGGPRHFHGMIGQVSMPAPADNDPQYELTVVPRLWLLGLHSQNRVYRESTAVEIVQQVCSEHGVTVSSVCKRTYEKRDFTVQYRESALAFIHRLMEQYGIWYVFKHTASSHAIELQDDPSHCKTVAGLEQIDFARPSRTTPLDKITGWGVSTGLSTTELFIRDYDFRKPTTSLETSAPVPHVHLPSADPVNDKPAYEEFPGAYTDLKDEGKKFAEGQEMAKARAQELAVRAVQFGGQATCRRLSAGQRFKLTDTTGALAQPFKDKEFVVTSTTIAGRNDSIERGGGTGGSVDVQLTAVPGSYEYRPPRITPKPLVTGAQTAVVVGPKDTEIHTDEFGRVKVLFHWDRLGDPSKGDTSCWVRVAQVWAGKSWGAMFIPRVGQEVIVEFLEGDPDQPIVTGRVYNGSNMPPYKLPDQKNVSCIKSDSTQRGKDGTPVGFNEIKFDDTKDKELFFTHAQKDMTEVVLNNQTSSVSANRSENVGGTHTETIKKDTKVTVTEGNEEHVVARGTYTETVKKDYSVTVQDGKMNYEIEPGDMTITVKTGGFTASSKDQAWIESTDKTTTIKAKNNVIIKSDSADVEAEAGGSHVLIKCGQSQAKLEKSGTITISGLKIAVSGTTEVNLSCGANYLKIDPAGVTIFGTLVKIN